MNTVSHPAGLGGLGVTRPVKRNLPSRDPLIKAARKAYRDSATGELDGLLAERRRWARKFTIAQNKLEAANIAILRLYEDLAKEKDGVKE